MPLVAGIDSSTQSCKVVVRDTDDGKLVREGHAAHPAGQEGLAESGVAELSRPTLDPGETFADLRADRSAFEEFDVEKAGARGYGYARLNQLMVEHVLGAR